MNGNTTNLNNNDAGGGGVANYRTRATVATSLSNGQQPTSHIPLPRYTSAIKMAPSPNNKTAAGPNNKMASSATVKMASPGANPANNEAKWKVRYEESERKRKSLLGLTQKNDRDFGDLEKRYQRMLADYTAVSRQLGEKDAKLNQLRAVSEKVYKEYDLLKTKYEVDTRVMQGAMTSASQWYRQNRELKRKSAALAQRFLQFRPGESLDNVDALETSVVSSDTDELENLKTIIQDLSREVAKLQSEVNAARLQEFEAQEQIVNLTAELDEERQGRTAAERELEELRTMRQNLGRVSRLVAEEMTSLRDQCQQEKEATLRMKSQADKAQKERNVLAHQSSLLMCDVMGDEKTVMLLQEAEAIKGLLEEERQQHAAQLQELQDKLEERENEAELELLEEKLKLAESELQCALHRAERAELDTSQLSNKVTKLEEELGSKKCPPPPPMPPPPPPMPCSTLQRRPQKPPEEGCQSGNPVLEMANILGIPRKQTGAVATPGGAIDDIINQIKGGRFTLKTTEQKQKEKKDEPPAAVQEMLSILGTLKRRPRTRPCVLPNPPPADVAL